MNKNFKIILTAFCATLSMSISILSSAQDTKKIAGQYDNGLYIFEDNTFLAGGVNSVVFGTVEVEGNIIKLKKHHPKQKFSLYGRKTTTKVSGNTIMFQGFEHNGLVNLSENNDGPKVLRRVFNEGANCCDWPNLYENSENCKVIYLADENDSTLYKFELPPDYRDFVAFRFDFEDDPNLYQPIFAMIANDLNSISFENSGKKVMKKPLDKDILQTREIVMSMYARAYPEGKYYYCNPAYNIFEETGIALEAYKEIDHNDNGVLQLKGSKKHEPSSQNRLEFDFHSNDIIYRYEKLDATVMSNTNFSIDNKSIFTFVCENQMRE